MLVVAEAAEAAEEEEEWMCGRCNCCLCVAAQNPQEIRVSLNLLWQDLTNEVSVRCLFRSRSCSVFLECPLSRPLSLAFAFALTLVLSRMCT